MIRKIAILRGINVGGKRKILMADLKLIFESLNFSNVTTYIQSGNVIFDSDDEMDEFALSRKIENKIKEEFGFEVPVIVRTSEELEKLVNENPFCKSNVEIEHLHLTFLKDTPTDKCQQAIEAYNFEPDKFAICDKDIFVYCEGKYHQSKLTNNFFEHKLETPATTRNWKTVLKLLALSSASLQTCYQL